jgi:hypothetical protein
MANLLAYISYVRWCSTNTLGLHRLAEKCLRSKIQSIELTDIDKLVIYLWNTTRRNDECEILRWRSWVGLDTLDLLILQHYGFYGIISKSRTLSTLYLVPPINDMSYDTSKTKKIRERDLLKPARGTPAANFELTAVDRYSNSYMELSDMTKAFIGKMTDIKSEDAHGSGVNDDSLYWPLIAERAVLGRWKKRGGKNKSWRRVHDANIIYAPVKCDTKSRLLSTCRSEPVQILLSSMLYPPFNILRSLDLRVHHTSKEGNIRKKKALHYRKESRRPLNLRRTLDEK